MWTLSKVHQLVTVLVVKCSSGVKAVYIIKLNLSTLRFYLFCNVTLDVVWMVYWIFKIVTRTSLAILRKLYLVLYGFYVHPPNFQLHFHR